MIYGDCSASKVQTGAACGNEAALRNQNVERGSEHRLLTAGRISRGRARASTSEYTGSNSWMFAKTVDVRACEAIAMAAKRCPKFTASLSPHTGQM